MQKLFSLIAIALALFGGNAAAQNATNPDLARYTGSYKSQTAMTANTPDTIVAPGSNTRGIIVWMAAAHDNGGGTSNSTLIAKTSAPTSVLDGDVLWAQFMSGSTQYGANSPLQRAIFIAPGKGLYFINGTTVTVAFRYVLYSIL